MSWSLSTVLEHEHTDAGIHKDLEVLNRLDRTNIGNQHALAERDAQITASIDAVLRCLSDAPTFDNAEEVAVSMSGHANPGNVAVPGMANEYIQIRLHANKYRVPS